MKCPKCFIELEPGAQFCGNCGSVISNVNSNQNFSTQTADPDATTVLTNDQPGIPNGSNFSAPTASSVNSPVQANEQPVVCQFCGYSNVANATFCMRCGKPLSGKVNNNGTVGNNQHQNIPIQSAPQTDYQQPSGAQFYQPGNPQPTQNSYQNSGNFQFAQMKSKKPFLNNIFTIFKAPVTNGLAYIKDGNALENSAIIVIQKLLLAFIPMAMASNLLGDFSDGSSASAFFSFWFVLLLSGFGFPLLFWFFDKVIFKGTSNFSTASSVTATKALISMPFIVLSMFLSFIVDKDMLVLPLVLLIFGIACGAFESVKVLRSATEANEDKQYLAYSIAWCLTLLIVLLVSKGILSNMIDDVIDELFW